MKYAITGANGMIGKALTLRLAEEGNEVVAIFRSATPEAFEGRSNIHVLKGDVTDLSFLMNALKGVDGVFHVAAFAKPWARDKQVYYSINERGTENVCEAALKNGVKRMVYTSSAGTHGAQQGIDLIHEETWPEAYHTDYEQSKFNGRQVALKYNDRGLEVNVVSPARVYAPGDNSESNVPVRLMRIYTQRKFGFVPANGEGVGSYVYIDDIVDGHLIAMQTHVVGEEFLLGGINESYLDFFRIYSEVSGLRYPVYKIPYQLSLGIGKMQLFAAENFGVKPAITTPWVRRYLKHWGVNSAKIQALGYRITPLELGMERVLSAIKS
jgi:nucleoside-diphosphate-sugar epimerase